MAQVFKNHTVVCGWNSRAKQIVESLQALTSAPIIVITDEICSPIREVGDHKGVFIVSGDCSSREALLGVDIVSAKSVIVLANDSLGEFADAFSVKVALAVEKVQVSVHTVVELRDLRNKDHFVWTKVDEVISAEEISVKMMAQGIRHILSKERENVQTKCTKETLLLETYEDLVCPHGNSSQLFRVNLPWQQFNQLTFADIVSRGVKAGVLPLAAAGYIEHEIPPRPDQKAWMSWKTKVIPNPKPTSTFDSLWPKWPGEEYPLGIITLAPSRVAAERLGA